MGTQIINRANRAGAARRLAAWAAFVFALLQIAILQARTSGDWPVWVSDVSFSTAEIHWNAFPDTLCNPGDTVSYTVRFRPADSTSWNIWTTGDTLLTLDSLQSAAVYEVWLSGACGGATLNYDQATFSTASTWKETPGGHLVFNSATARIGIGTSAPTARLHVGGSLLAEGNTCPTPASGPGTRMMWVPSKAAFRAGEVTGALWDAASLGQNSAAIGYNPRSLGGGRYRFRPRDPGLGRPQRRLRLGRARHRPRRDCHRRGRLRRIDANVYAVRRQRR